MYRLWVYNAEFFLWPLDTQSHQWFDRRIVKPAWLWDSQSRVATPLGLEKYEVRSRKGTESGLLVSQKRYWQGAPFKCLEISKVFFILQIDDLFEEVETEIVQLLKFLLAPLPSSRKWIRRGRRILAGFFRSSSTSSTPRAPRDLKILEYLWFPPRPFPPSFDTEKTQ